jgi:hypothetical protein
VTKTYRDPQGNEVTEITTEEVQAVHRDWTADFSLEIGAMYPDRWGNQRMAEMEAMKTLIEGGLLPDGVIDALLQGEEERRSRIQRAVRGETAPRMNANSFLTSISIDRQVICISSSHKNLRTGAYCYIDFCVVARKNSA